MKFFQKTHFVWNIIIGVISIFFAPSALAGPMPGPVNDACPTYINGITEADIRTVVQVFSDKKTEYEKVYATNIGAITKVQEGIDALNIELEKCKLNPKGNCTSLYGSIATFQDQIKSYQDKIDIAKAEKDNAFLDLQEMTGEVGEAAVLQEATRMADQNLLDFDGDCVIDSKDAFPKDPAESEDTDGDGIGDNADTDDDNDGVLDVDDPFPKDPTKPNDSEKKKKTGTAGIVPCGLSYDDKATLDIDESKPCTICHLAVGINTIITTLTKWIFIIAVVIIGIAGVMYVVSAGNQAMTQLAKAAIKNALIGAAVILVAWVVVVFVMKTLSVKPEELVGENAGALVQGANAWTFNCSTNTSATTPNTTQITQPTNTGTGVQLQAQ